MTTQAIKGPWFSPTGTWPARRSPGRAGSEVRKANTGRSSRPVNLPCAPGAGCSGPSPLRADQGGVIRIGQTRVSLDLVIRQFERGMTPEEIVRAYDTLALEDVYAALDYYRWHRDEVRLYLNHREEAAEALRAQVEAKGPHITREELLARRRARGMKNAPAGE